MRVKNVQVKPSGKTNPQLGNFLSAPQPQNPQEEVKVPKQTVAPKNKENHDQIEEIEKEIERIELELGNLRSFDLSVFNEVVYKKNLMFRLLMIRAKIYVLVKDPNSGKIVTVVVNPPRWGGSSLRYLINNCVSDWCEVAKKKTAKGEILSYSSGSNSSDGNDIENIFFD